MKLRIHGNAIRLRLSRTDVARFSESGYIVESVDFGPMGKFNYALMAAEDFTLRCKYDRSGMCISVPRNLAHDWIHTDRVDISGDQPFDNGSILHVAVEKDFQCIHKDSEFNLDAYPNPLSSHAD